MKVNSKRKSVSSNKHLSVESLYLYDDHVKIFSLFDMIGINDSKLISNPIHVFDNEKGSMN